IQRTTALTTTRTVAQVSRPTTMQICRTPAVVSHPQTLRTNTQLVSLQVPQYQQHRVSQLQTMLRRQVSERRDLVTTTSITRTTVVRPPAPPARHTPIQQITHTTTRYAPTQHIIHRTTTPTTTTRLTAVTQRRVTECQRPTVQLRVSMT